MIEEKSNNDAIKEKSHKAVIKEKSHKDVIKEKSHKEVTIEKSHKDGEKKMPVGIPKDVKKERFAQRYGTKRSRCGKDKHS